ncbi:LysR family transcriptional regulator [Pseudoruegeria sp. HB172150]|uniref:LysR family transcriptional regulator n=1 Tax=Pseudoruegeria sp. HB172150 TaxID=2721164 RepID=UPI00155782D0|nr:LysR family transcriptional regulator [Pseudoruegeria sp. HB172150]
MDELHRIDWSLVQAFLAVAETGSLSAAARELGTSQPTVGRQIRALEEQLGAELVQRRPRGLALTSLAESMLPPARAMREATREMAMTAAGQEQDIRGTVRITASVAMSVHHLPAILAGVRSDHPEISVELVATDSSRNLLYREADIAVRMYRPTQLDLVARHLGEIPLAAFAAKSYIARRGRPTADTLMEHDVVGFDTDPLILEGFREAGRDVDREWFSTRCDDHIAQWQLVRMGAGVGFAQQAVGRADPLVEELDLDFPFPELPVWLTAHEAMRHTPRIRLVWDRLAEGLMPLVS